MFTYTLYLWKPSIFRLFQNAKNIIRMIDNENFSSLLNAKNEINQFYELVIDKFPLDFSEEFGEKCVWADDIIFSDYQIVLTLTGQNGDNVLDFIYKTANDSYLVVFDMATNRATYPINYLRYRFFFSIFNISILLLIVLIICIISDRLIK